MTIAEAQRFVARWRKILMPVACRTEAEALNAMERSCVGMCMGMALIVFVSLISHLSRSVAAFACMVGLFSFWLVLQFRAVRRLLASHEDLSK